MKWLRAIVREIFGLFVDDGSFALAIFVWLTLMWLAASHLHLPLSLRLHLPAWWRAILLFAGLGVLLVESALRTARRHWESRRP